MEEKNCIVVKGARENNLKNVDVNIPRNKMIVMTGVSGSGKTSLAFDTIYAEGQRRYVESLSSYARQFLGGVEKPDVDLIEGLSPAIAIDQKTTSKNPRSTVGTVTEIYDYLRLLYARVGKPYCPNHHIEISGQTYQEMVDSIYQEEPDSRIIIYAPIAENKKGAFEKTFENLRKNGYSKVLIDDEMFELDEEIALDKNKKHNILVVIDRVRLKEEARSRIYESIETAAKLSEGKIYVDINGERKLFNENFSCPYCGFTVTNLEPALFSFNSPLGACPECKGLGFISALDEELLITDENLSIADGAIRYIKNTIFTENIEWQTFKKLFEYYNIDIYKPYKDLTEEEKDIILHGSKEPIELTIQSSGGFTMHKKRMIEGIADLIARRYEETSSNMQKEYYGSYMMEVECPTCHGNRLSKMALSVLVGGKNIYEFTCMSIEEALEFVKNLKFTKNEEKISFLIIKELKERLQFLKDVGLEYLTLSRKAGTLSGGEAQRIRLATQIGSHLTGVLYVLDEPSIGLHQRDNGKLIQTLKNMRDLGNTLLIVEHDEEIMHECDYIVDIGPYAGVHGGEVVAAGTPEELIKNGKSITSDYLSGRRKIKLPEKRRTEETPNLTIVNATANNLKNITVNFPLHKLIVVTGVSGSGKSTLVNYVLNNAISKKLYKTRIEVGAHEKILGLENIDHIINIDQSPIGRTPRSNPATYTGVFDNIRDLFASTIEAKKRGYAKGRFSFNVKGGRCESCWGDGIIRIAMHFLPDVYVECNACKGKRYNAETLEVKYKGKSIADVLDMTIEESVQFFENIPSIYNKLKTLNEVGLGYVKLGQSATTLSGGEAQRVKLASELHKRITSKTLFILDEPTTGLHTYDIQKLIDILNRIVDAKGTVVVIEHNLDVIKVADYIIDLGPEGGDKGGNVIATGTPEEVSENPNSITGTYIKKALYYTNKELY